LEALIDTALSHADPARCNRAITEAHYVLSQALGRVLGLDAGANFHSWAVWGSKKAGVTIRQEDLDTALRDASWAGGSVGGLVGLAVGHKLGYFWPKLGLLAGTLSGWVSGRAIARWSRRKAARLVLDGNRLVLDDIGRQTARFCATFAPNSPMGPQALAKFCRSVPEPLLSTAFQHYGLAAISGDRSSKCQHSYYANLLSILHEHQKLQPYIAKSMPFIVKRCVTKRLMQFEIDALCLSVSQDVPPLSEMREFPEELTTLTLPELKEFLARWERCEGRLENSRATDWSLLGQRMAYIVGLFRRFHTDSSVTAPPFPQPA
jgi:hypothetical protein